MIEPLSHSVNDVNRTGQGLIQSAAGGVNTSGLEKDLEKLNDKWNALKDKVRISLFIFSAKYTLQSRIFINCIFL